MKRSCAEGVAFGLPERSLSAVPVAWNLAQSLLTDGALGDVVVMCDIGLVLSPCKRSNAFSRFLWQRGVILLC